MGVPTTKITGEADLAVRAEQGEVKVGSSEVPWSGWVSENPAYEGRFIIAEGWTGIPELYDEFCQEMARRGITTITFKTPRVEGIRAFSPLSFLHAWRDQPEAILAVEQDTRFIGGNEMPSRHVLGAHSGSAESVMQAALESEPDYVFLAGAAGQVAKGWFDLAHGNIGRSFLPGEGAQVAYRELRAHPGRAARHTLNTVLHPWETLGEGIKAGSSDIVGHMEEASTRGIRVINLLLNNDQIFPADEIAAHISGRATAHHSELEGHLAPQTQPQAFADEVVLIHHQVISGGKIGLAVAA